MSNLCVFSTFIKMMSWLYFTVPFYNWTRLFNLHRWVSKLCSHKIGLPLITDRNKFALISHCLFRPMSWAKISHGKSITSDKPNQPTDYLTSGRWPRNIDMHWFGRSIKSVGTESSIGSKNKLIDDSGWNFRTDDFYLTKVNIVVCLL